MTHSSGIIIGSIFGVFTFVIIFGVSFYSVIVGVSFYSVILNIFLKMASFMEFKQQYTIPIVAFTIVVSVLIKLYAICDDLMKKMDKLKIEMVNANYTLSVLSSRSRITAGTVAAVSQRQKKQIANKKTDNKTNPH